MTSQTKRVLSIQGQPVRGYAGNSSATFPLQVYNDQVIGFDVDPILTVQFSCHPGYEIFGTGQALNETELREIIRGLKANSLLKYSHLLTGYCRDNSLLEVVHSLALELKNNNKDLIFVCDPCFGDEGVWYVPKEVLPVYKDKLLPMADLTTPNQFELETITGIQIKTEEDAVKAIDCLLAMGPKTVVLSSMPHPTKPDVLVALGKGQNGEYARVEMLKVPAHFTGTGDLFTALLLAWCNEGLQTACEKAVSVLNELLNRTLKYALAMSNGGPPTVEQLELRLIQNKELFENPPVLTEIKPNSLE